jgi:hypothetical protein
MESTTLFQSVRRQTSKAENSSKLRAAELDKYPPAIVGGSSDSARKSREELTGILRRLMDSLRHGSLYASFLLGCNAAALAIDSIVIGRNMFHYFTLFTLAEAALLFLVGGGLDIGGSLSFSRVMDYVSKREGSWTTEGHERAQSRAAAFISAGIILFLLSFALAYPLN